MIQHLPPSLPPPPLPSFIQTKEKMDMDDDERMAQFIDRQIEKAEAGQALDEVSPPVV